MKRLILGVEIGGTKLQLAIGTPDGRILHHKRGAVCPEMGATGILRWFERELPALLIETSIPRTEIAAISVGFGGPIDSGKGTVVKSMQIAGWNDFPLRDWFETAFGLPCFLYNDSSAAGYGEYCLGFGKGTKQFFYTNIGSGIGGSLVIDGRLYDGQGYGAAELGQTRIPNLITGASDERLEALCSGWAVQSRLRQPGYVPKTSKLMTYCGGDITRLNGQLLGKAVREQDLFACRELDTVAEGMAIALTNVLCLFSPEVISVGGGFSLIGEPLFSRIRKELKRREFIGTSGRYRLEPCKLGEDVVLQGSLVLAAQALGM